MLNWVREGDEVIVTKVDQLARSVADLLNIIERIRAKGAAIYIGNLGRINGDPTGTLLLNVLSAIAQFERQMMLERQREGIAKVKNEGQYKGRALTARAKATEVRELAAQGLPKVEISRRLGLGERSVYRIYRTANVSIFLSSAEISQTPGKKFRESLVSVTRPGWPHADLTGHRRRPGGGEGAAATILAGMGCLATRPQRPFCCADDAADLRLGAADCLHQGVDLPIKSAVCSDLGASAASLLLQLFIQMY